MQKVTRGCVIWALVCCGFGMLCRLVLPYDETARGFSVFFFCFVLLFLLIVLFEHKLSRKIRRILHNHDYIVFEAVLIEEKVIVDDSADGVTKRHEYVFEHPQERTVFTVPSVIFRNIAIVGSTYYIFAIPHSSGLYDLHQFYLQHSTVGYTGLSDELQRNFQDSVPPLRTKYRCHTN